MMKKISSIISLSFLVLLLLISNMIKIVKRILLLTIIVILFSGIAYSADWKLFTHNKFNTPCYWDRESLIYLPNKNIRVSFLGACHLPWGLFTVNQPPYLLYFVKSYSTPLD